MSVRSSQGLFSCEQVVVAAGAWSGEIPLSVNGSRVQLPGTYPVRGILVGRKFAARTLGPFVRRGHSYVLQRESGFAIAGTTAEKVGFDRTVTSDAVAGVIAGVESLWKDFSKGADTESWLGFRPASESGEPHIGRLGDLPVWMAYGHFRNGILMAPVTSARIAAELIG